MMVVPNGTSHRPPASISTFVAKLTTPPFNRSVAPSATVSNPVNALLLAVSTALFLTTTAVDCTVPTTVWLVRIV